MPTLPELNTKGSDILGTFALANQINSQKRQEELIKSQLTLEAEKMKKSQLDHESNLLAIGEKSAKFIETPEDYDNWRQYMMGFGMNSALVKESNAYAPGTDFKDVGMKLSMEAKAYSDLKKGKETVMSKVNPDGTISKVKATTTEDAAKYAKDGFDIGDRSGTPRQTLQDKIAETKALTKAKEEEKAKFKQGEPYAPQHELYINQETGESKMINVRNPNEVSKITSGGFTPVTPEMRGYGVESGKASATREKEINTESAKAAAQLNTLHTLDQLVDRIETGKLAKVTMRIQQYANAFDIPIDVKELGDKEAFNAMTEQLALQSRNMGEGMVLAGQMSDRDVQFLRDMNPQLILSKGGNKKLLRVRMAMSKRQNEIAQHMRDYKKQNKGRFDATGFDEYVQQRLNKKSVFGIPDGSKFIGTDKQTGLPVYETTDGKTIIPEF